MMKRIMEFIVPFKMIIGLVFIGEIILFMIAKSFFGVYEISFITIISFFIMATLVTIIKYIFESDFMQSKIIRGFLIIMQYLITCGIVLIMNMIFDYFIISGIEYLYLLMFITFCYFGGMLGFYLISKQEINVMNSNLLKYRKNKKICNNTDK